MPDYTKCEKCKSGAQKWKKGSDAASLLWNMNTCGCTCKINKFDIYDYNKVRNMK